jgi:nitrate reductase NapE component
MSLVALLLTAVLFGIAISAAALLFVRSAGEERARRLAYIVLPIAAAVALVCIVRSALYYSVFPSWAAARLAVAYWVKQGHPLYYGQQSGPLLGTNYTPLYFLYYLPATFLPGPTVALIVASLMGAAAALIPASWVHTQLPPSLSDRKFWKIAGTITFLVIAINLFPITYAIFTVRGDALVLGLVAIAAGLIYRSQKPSAAALWAAAACLVFAEWSKQTAAPAFLAVLLFMLTADRLSEALWFLFRLAILGLGTTVVALLAFAFRTLIFNTIEFPAHHPWQYLSCFEEELPCRTAETARDRLLTILWMTQHYVSEHLALFSALLIVLGLSATIATRSGVRGWMNEHRWMIFLFIAALMLPLSVANRIKTGGEDSAMALTGYFLLLSLTLGLIQLATYSRQIASTALVILCALSATYMSQSIGTIESLPRIADQIATNPEEQAVKYIRRHPGEVYFPWTPLASILVEHAAYHFDYFVDERKRAGYGLSEAHYLAGIPKRFTMIAYPPRFGDAQQRAALDYLPAFSYQVKVPELDGWTVFTSRQNASSISGHGSPRPITTK